MQVLHPGQSGASARSPTQNQSGSGVGVWGRAAARLGLSPAAPLPSSLSAAAVESASTGAAIPARWARRRGREPPDTASPTPGAPSPTPGASHITRWEISGLSVRADQLTFSLWVAAVSVSHLDYKAYLQVIAEEYTEAGRVNFNLRV